MVCVNILVTLFMILTHLCSSAFGDEDGYVQEACSVTQYRNLCIRSLESFSNSAKQSPSLWARAGVSVTIGEAKNASQYLMKLQKHSSWRGRNRIALSDCIECFEDAIDNLHRSLGVLRKLDGPSFEDQMGDVTTWVSSAMTDEDTCLDGFDGQNGRRGVENLKKRVLYVTYITSNALALVNKLATTGPKGLH